MIGFVAFNLVLGIGNAGVMHVALVVHVPDVYSDDMTPDATSLGIPADVIADLKGSCHDETRQSQKKSSGAGTRSYPRSDC
jgi:hypothetical protein